MVDGAISVKPVKWQYRGNRVDSEWAIAGICQYRDP